MTEYKRWKEIPVDIRDKMNHVVTAWDGVRTTSIYCERFDAEGVGNVLQVSNCIVDSSLYHRGIPLETRYVLVPWVKMGGGGNTWFIRPIGIEERGADSSHLKPKP